MDSSLGVNAIDHPYILPSDESLKDLDLFFANGLYDSCQATDELIKSIEKSQDETLARKALNLYQRHLSTLERPWDHVTFMYGLGLIYMHFNAYNWAVKSFRETIYVQPNFARSRDVHTRLGLIFKATGRYRLSEKHFNLAINDTRPDGGASSKLQLRFHLANLYEIQGKIKQAIEAYEKLLKENDLPQQLSANIHRQLGWLYFNNSDSSINLDTAQGNNNHRREDSMHDRSLNPSTSNNHKLQAALNCFNTSYQTDSDPKTSYYLGRCFTNIGKFQDAFVKYRSVIDREESTADTWCSIGVLYHRQNQPMDALQAYIRSVQFDKKHSVAWMNLGVLYESYNQFQDALKCYQHVLRSKPNDIDPSLRARIKYIQKHMAEIGTFLTSNGKPRLSSDKLLSLEDLWNLESKTSSEANNNINNNNDNKSSNSNQNPNASANTISMQRGPIKSAQEQPNQAANSSQSIAAENMLTPVAMASSSMNHVGSNMTPKGETSVTLKNEINSTSNQNQTSSPCSNHIGLPDDCKHEVISHSSQDFKPQSIDAKDFCLSQVLTNGTSKDSGISSNSSTYTDCALVPSQSIDVNVASQLTAEQVIESYRNLPRPRKLDVNLLSEEEKPASTILRPPPYPPLPSDKLFPSPPSVFLESKKDIISKKIQEVCQSSPISIVRNIASVLKLDLGLFSTKTLVESNPDQQINIVSHLSHLISENNGEQLTNHWSSECQEATSTISRYASYQVGSFRESLEEERDNKTKANPTKESETDSNESASAQAKRNYNNSHNSQSCAEQQVTGNQRGPANKKFKRETPKRKHVRSADKIDLSDDKKWRSQLNELNKLPHFIKCVSASNMLTHIGAAIPDVNTITMSMHIPGCKMLGNRTPNNFCPVNINVGPGDYEWCAISPEYSRLFIRLCNRHGYEFDSNSWWPRLSDLQKHNIPIYRFSQRPGDLVWVNSGTIYWVQATGWCNNIHWNVGPLCARQYKLASESAEFNKLTFCKSGVPMVQLTWNIAINISFIPDDDLWHSITDVLRRSLKYCVLVRDFVYELKQKIIQQEGEVGPEFAKYCSLCEIEVFNICFFRKSDNSLHCVECARRADPALKSYEIKQKYELTQLMKLYDNFIGTKRKFPSNNL